MSDIFLSIVSFLNVIVIAFIIFIMIFLYFKTLRRSYQLFKALVTIRYQTKDIDVAHFAEEVIKFVDNDEKTIKLGLNHPGWFEKL